MMFSLRDLYLSDLRGRRNAAPNSSNGQATITFAVEDPEQFEGTIAVSTSVRVRLHGNDESVLAELSSEYRAIITVDTNEWSDHSGEIVESPELMDFVNGHLYPRHRERLMELTLRMGLPIFKLPITMPEFTDADESDVAAVPLVAERPDRIDA